MRFFRPFINELKYLWFLYTTGGFFRIKDYFVQNVSFDLKYGTHTSGWLQPQDFEQKPINIEHGVRYRASYTDEVVAALDQVKKIINPNDFTFIDIGCGKGKVLLLAAMHHTYKNIIGIDYYQPFLDIAQKNLKKIGASDRTTLIHTDATEFKDFSDQAVIYMYNPFDDHILLKVKENIQKNCKRAILIYNKPLHSHLFSDWYTFSKKRGRSPDWETSIYLFAADREVQHQRRPSDAKAA